VDTVRVLKTVLLVTVLLVPGVAVQGK